MEVEALGLFTDASAAVGFGAFWDGHWCASLRDPFWVSNGVVKNLVLLELFPVVVALVIWGNFF